MPIDRLFADPDLASLYDAFCEGRPDFPFYLPYIMDATAILDVGCGTGALLHIARESGHTGRLVGLDPAEGMLAQARRRSDIEWVHGDLSDVDWVDTFDLIVMTGHAFQVLIEDTELRTSLDAICSALTDDGRFLFETRNPTAKGWEAWIPDKAVEIRDDSGLQVRLAHEVVSIERDLVTFTTTFTSPSWGGPEVSQSTLRFLDNSELLRFLSESGLRVESQYGDWDRSPITNTSAEIITFARV